MKQAILIIGSGGREHALAWKLAQSARVGKIYVAPGNAGTAGVGKSLDSAPLRSGHNSSSPVSENIPIASTDIPALVKFAEEKEVDLVVVGPDDPLAMGAVDAFREKGVAVFGPTKAAAQVEASKAFAKKVMDEEGIPTARFAVFTDYNLALKHLREYCAPRSSEGAKWGLPIVIKASGLALGKGVTVCETLAQAEQALEDAMVKKVFGEAGSTVLIEEFLAGREFSAHALTDGKTFQLFPSSQDHKRAGEGDEGPNTGGMGTIAPVPWVMPAMMGDIATKVVEPALRGLRKHCAAPAPTAVEGFTGLLYPGLMMTDDGPKVLEFNARFGDPETQSYMRLLKTDLLDLLEACAGPLSSKGGSASGGDSQLKSRGRSGQLSEAPSLSRLGKLEWEPGFACCIVLASKGYPGKYEKGFPITGIEEAEKTPGVVVFHAGTAVKSGQLVTNGGRVLGVSAVGATLREALGRAYSAVEVIQFEGKQYRKDIGAKSLTAF